MNTLIQTLAEQAAEHAVLNYSGEVLQSETEDVKIQIPKEFINEFAELIVRECASLAYDGPGGILEHFGVEDV